MRRLLTAVMAAWLLSSHLAAWAAAAPDDALPTDPALVTGALPNGLSYIVRRHANPERRVSIWLHVATGSLNETEETRGLAHYLEHLAFNGSANFPPGAVIPYFQSLGMAFGRDQNAFTSFDQTTYQLTLPEGGREMLGKGLLFMSDVATRLSLLPAEIDSERQIILEEKRARASAGQRVSDLVYERLAPESTFGRRLPIGTEQTIKAITPEQFREYYTRWYVPSNMTVIVVGDTDPALAVELIAEHFGGGPGAPRPARRDAGVKPTAGQRAIVATDAELTRASVSINRVDLPRPVATTVSEKRRDLVYQIGAWLFNRRMGADLATGRVSYLDADASFRTWPAVLQLTAVEASGRPGTWRAMLGELGTALQRARLHGFTDRELADARQAFIAHAEESAQRESTRTARDVIREINGAVTRGEPLMSASQSLELLRQLLPGITVREVSDAFAAEFDPSRAVFIAELPASDAVPSEDELVRLARAAVEVKPDAVADATRATALLASEPRAGTVVDSRSDETTGVTSMWLDNGARVHHRFMDQRKNEASISITLAGGQIQETAATRGFTEAALRAWDRPASRRLSSTEIRDLMVGAKVRVRGGMTGDSVSLTVSGAPSDLERGLQLAHVLLTEPRIERAALEQWKESEVQRIAGRKTQPMEALGFATVTAFYASDERPWPLSKEQVERIELPAAQVWLERLIAGAPIEVGIVGDIDRETATRLVARYIGGLSARPRIGPKTLFDLRKISRPGGPIRIEEVIDARTPQAGVFAGFFGANLTDVRDTRLLNLAARVLSTRMTRAIREERQLVYSIGASSQPGIEYPGFGLFAAGAPTDPGKAPALAAAIEEMYDTFAKDGPTADELGVAKKQMINLVDEVMKNPDFWLGRLATLDYRGLSVPVLLQASTDYQQFTADEVRDAFARYDIPESRFRVVVKPR